MGNEDRISQVEKAIIGLRGMIMSGDFAAGTRLPEVALSERLGISRTPLRQAMDRLVAEGLLERMTSGGCRVASFNLDDINDAIELRGVVEGTAARLAAERSADPDLMAEAEAVLDNIDTALRDPERIDFDAYVRLNARFHVILSGLSGSDMAQFVFVAPPFPTNQKIFLRRSLAEMLGNTQCTTRKRLMRRARRVCGQRTIEALHIRLMRYTHSWLCSAGCCTHQTL